MYDMCVNQREQKKNKAGKATHSEFQMFFFFYLSLSVCVHTEKNKIKGRSNFFSTFQHIRTYIIQFLWFYLSFFMVCIAKEKQDIHFLLKVSVFWRHATDFLLEKEFYLIDLMLADVTVLWPVCRVPISFYSLSQLLSFQPFKCLYPQVFNYLSLLKYLIVSRHMEQIIT